jgi:hypothetical protein
MNFPMPRPLHTLYPSILNMWSPHTFSSVQAEIVEIPGPMDAAIAGPWVDALYA